MSSRLRIAIAVSLLMALAQMLFAQEQTPMTSLQELIDQLEKNNPEVRAARFRFEAATKRPSQVSTLPSRSPA